MTGFQAVCNSGELSSAQTFRLAENNQTKADIIAEKVGQVYVHFAKGFAITLVTALAAAKVGFAATIISLVATNASMTAILLTAVSVILCVATRSIPKESALLKQASYGLFAVWQGLVISPLVLFNSSAFAIASIGTVALTGALGALSMTLKESFEKYEKIFFVALGAIALASLGACLLTGGAAAFANEVSLVGGFALFGCLVIYNTHKARSDALNPQFDEINHSMEIYLDALNLFVRFFEIINRNDKK